MKLFQLFLAASIPVIKVILVTLVGSFIALDRINILPPEARKYMNHIVFYVFNPALIFANLAKTLTMKSLVELWYMPLNIFITFVVGSIIGWVVIHLTKALAHLSGLILSCCSAGLATFELCYWSFANGLAIPESFRGISNSETWSKQSRRKKTFPELQEEERFLMKGKFDLNTLDYPLQSANKVDIEASSKLSKKPRYDQSHLRETVTFDHTSSVSGTSGNCNNQNPVMCTSSTLVDSYKAQTDNPMNRVILPDLNLPVEEDSNSETLYGMS